MQTAESPRNVLFLAAIYGTTGLGPNLRRTRPTQSIVVHYTKPPRAVLLLTASDATSFWYLLQHGFDYRLHIRKEE